MAEDERPAPEETRFAAKAAMTQSLITALACIAIAIIIAGIIDTVATRTYARPVDGAPVQCGEFVTRDTVAGWAELCRIALTRPFDGSRGRTIFYNTERQSWSSWPGSGSTHSITIPVK